MSAAALREENAFIVLLHLDQLRTDGSTWVGSTFCSIQQDEKKSTVLIYAMVGEILRIMQVGDGSVLCIRVHQMRGGGGGGSHEISREVAY